LYEIAVAILRPVMGRFLHRNYSGYLVRTNADIPELEIIFAGEFDLEESCGSVGQLGGRKEQFIVAQILLKGVAARERFAQLRSRQRIIEGCGPALHAAQGTNERSSSGIVSAMEAIRVLWGAEMSVFYFI
jgi:hypothetical protein